MKLNQKGLKNLVKRKNLLLACISTLSKEAILSTAVVYICGANGPVLGRVMFDGGSQALLITREFCERANIT